MASNYKYAMKDEEFKQRLSEVADWEIPDVTCGGNTKKGRGAGRPSKEQQYQEQHEEAFLEMFGGKNPTVCPFVTKIKVAGCVCDDCGKFCEQGRHKERTKYTSNRPHWRERCITCGMNQNPNTGEFDLNNKEASAHWANWLRKTSQKPYAYQSKKLQNNCDKNEER